MKFTRGWKIVLGIVTVAAAVFPFVSSGGIMVMVMLNMPAIMRASAGGQLAIDQFMNSMLPLMAVFYPLMLCGGFIQLALSVFFMVLIVGNKELTDAIRILLVLAVFFKPFIGLPFYYFAYILPQKVPATGT